MNLKSISFTRWLSVVSIAGFLVIFLSLLLGINFLAWSNSILFIVIGFALFVLGGAKFFVYFKNGITKKEIVRIFYAGVGVISIFAGVLSTPLLSINFVVLDIVKLIISGIAIAVIIIEEWFN